MWLRGSCTVDLSPWEKQLPLSFSTVDKDLLACTLHTAALNTDPALRKWDHAPWKPSILGHQAYSCTLAWMSDSPPSFPFVFRDFKCGLFATNSVRFLLLITLHRQCFWFWQTITQGTIDLCTWNISQSCEQRAAMGAFSWLAINGCQVVVRVSMAGFPKRFNYRRSVNTWNGFL